MRSVVFDSSGSWFLHTGVYPLVDGESGARFDPGVPTKATPTDWVKAQPSIQPSNEAGEVGDALNKAPEPAQAPAKAPAAPKEPAPKAST